MSKARSLFIFEGARTETEAFIPMLSKLFGSSLPKEVCIFGGDIYQLYRKMKEDDFGGLDVVEVMRGRSEENARILEGLRRFDFAYVYLFFDYDAHAVCADDDSISEMLEYFDEESDNGKLFISYPMIEALRHYGGEETFRELKVKCKRRNCPRIGICEERESCLAETNYKDMSKRECLPQFLKWDRITEENWRLLVNSHLCKANMLVNERYEYPGSLIGQEIIFKRQKEKYIDRECPKVSVLSAYPLYLMHEYGVEGLREHLFPRGV